MTAPDMTSKDGAADVIADLLRTHSGAGLPVRLRLWDGSEAGPAGAPVLIARSPRALRRILWRPGELGLARAYISGDLDVDGDLADGLRRVWAAIGQKPPRAGARVLAASAPAALAAVRAVARLKVPVWPPPPPPRCELRVRGRLHSRARDQAVIAGHYDLPAAFYQLILDPSMAYSCGYWTGADTLADAQRAKLELICDKLGLQPGGRLLDMGCGWGSLTVHAARDHGARVTAVTLSAEQGGYVRQRVRGLGLADRAEVRIQDYRDPIDNTILTPEQVRVWRLYLAGGALAFEEGRMGVDQILAVRTAR
jgi:cyclopropane-fatty-acyl-phospholipid synthase